MIKGALIAQVGEWKRKHSTKIMLRIDKIRTFRLSCSIQIYVKRYYYLPEQTLCSELRRHFNSPDVRVSINRLMISFDTILPKLFSIQWHRMDWQLFVGARVRIEKKKYSCIIALLDTHFCKWLNPIDDNSFGGRFFFFCHLLRVCLRYISTISDVNTQIWA